MAASPEEALILADGSLYLMDKERIREILRVRRLRIAACRKSLMLFSIYYFSSYHKRKMAPFHRQWYRDMSFRDITGLFLITFRESAKTSIAKMKVIHSVCYRTSRFIIWTSYDQKKAEGNLYDIALELQTNKKILSDFGQLFYEDDPDRLRKTRKKSIGEFITSNGVKVKAYSTGQSPRGEVYGEHRPDLIILDDIETLKTIESEARTEEVRKYMDELLAGLSGDAKIILLGNRLVEGGSISYMEDRLKDDARFRVYDIPVKYPDGSLAWPDKYCHTDGEAGDTGRISLETKMKLLGPHTFNREMMNCPISDDEREFLKKWFIGITRSEVDRMETRNFLTIDTAVSEKTSADSTGICINFVGKDNRWNLIAYRVRYSPDELLEHIFYLCDSIKFEKVGIEKTVYYDVFRYLLDGEMRKRNKFLPIVELKHNSASKESRIRGLIQRYSSGSVRHISAKDLEDELYGFPRFLSDDVADAAAYQLQIARAPEQRPHRRSPIKKHSQFFK